MSRGLLGPVLHLPPRRHLRRNGALKGCKSRKGPRPHSIPWCGLRHTVIALARMRMPLRLGSNRASAVLSLLLCLALACAPSARTASHDAHEAAESAEVDSVLNRNVERIRQATAPYKDLAAAQAAGFPKTEPRCLSHPEMGVMGYHYADSRLLDDTLQLEKPEILLYAKDAEGRSVLTGVEYIIPYSKWTRKDAPRFLGRQLKRSDPLQLWYLHVWVWEENPSGLFADYNPKVKC